VNDQWFEVTHDQRPHVLTSVITRGDIAVYRLVEHMLSGGPPGVVARLGLADDGFDYSTRGDGLTANMRARIDQAIADISERRTDVPTDPTGTILKFDAAGNEIEDG
jgi:basic membrane lipoprotein Med (substrate-binding protein (PBP1-ABC) superfamily)